MSDVAGAGQLSSDATREERAEQIVKKEARVVFNFPNRKKEHTVDA